MNLFRLWFGLSERVDRRRYLISGLSLMALKYIVDASIVWVYAHRWWSPLDYATPLWLARQRALEGVPAGAVVVLAVLALPFLWIGISMTMRRAVDSGGSPWLSLLFFAPYVNLVFLPILALAPSAPAALWRAATPAPVLDERWRSALLAVATAVAVTIPTVLLSVYLRRSYSTGLFLGTPFTIGWLSGQVYNARHPRSIAATVQVALFAVLLVGAALVLLAAEGVFCIALAFPLAAGLAVAGSLFGRSIALRGREPSARVAVAALIAPVLVLSEPRPVAPSYVVVTRVEVAAAPESVWRRVVTFPDLPADRTGVFRIGVAAPVRARIEGRGVGATRYCDFTTGSFVEPITRWEDGRLLAFDIVRQAPPMQEWSPYRAVNPPHLDGYFRAVRGEFRLVPIPGGRTRLEGRTWYQVDMFPQGYWSLPAGWIVQSIHRKVLEHIKALTEADGNRPQS